MESLIKIDASVSSHIGCTRASNDDNFYLNGRYRYDYETENIQVSVENSGPEYIFTVSDGMDATSAEKGTHISVIKEIRKCHEKVKLSSKAIEVKLDQLCECVQESNNLIYSLSLANANEKNRKAAFAGLVITGGKAAAFSLGNSKAYLYRDGDIRQLSGDNKKADRLLKMGIITNDQVKVVANQLGASDGSRNEVRKSGVLTVKKGDVFLLCSDGIGDILDEDTVCGFIAREEDAGYLGNLLVKTALKNGSEDNITAMVIKIEEAPENEAFVSEEAEEDAGEEEDEDEKVSMPIKFPTSETHRREARTARKETRGKEEGSALKYVSTIAAVLLIAGVVYMTYWLWNSFRDGEKSAVVLETDPIGVETEAGDQDGQTAEGDSELDASGEELGEEVAGDGTGAEDGTVEYTIKSGDSLQKISKQFYGDPQKYKLIMEANNIKDPNKIQIGQVLVIPPEEQ